MPNNEVDDFLKDITTPDKKDEDIFAEKEVQTIPEKDDEQESEPKETDGEGRKNRRHRRWESQLREKELELARKEAALKALEGVTRETTNEIPPEWIALYGDTPEAHQAWRIQEKREQQLFSKAKEEAIREFEQRQAKVQEEQKQFETFIDDQLESLEDEHNIDLTSNAPAAKKARRELLELVSKASPKDEAGNITAYADFEAIYELYQSRKEKPDASRAKELSARTMVKSDSGAPKAPETTPGFNGWRRDFGL